MNNREIERKFTVEGLTYEEALSFLSEHYELGIDATSYDLYWAAPGTKADFIRLRENSRELTVKVTDRGTIIDRIEENVKVEKGSMKDAARALTLLYGRPMRLVKMFAVFYKLDSVICVYSVENDPKNRVFLEVESDELVHVDKEVVELNKKLTLTPVLHSLYEIFRYGL